MSVGVARLGGLLWVAAVSASAAPLGGLPTQGPTVSAFVLRGWALESTTQADLDGDGLADAVLVLLQDGAAERARAVVWLHAVKDGGFRLVDSNVGLLACFGCLGMKGGDAQPDIEVKGQVVSFSQSGGSRDAYGATHRFRFEKAGVRLIGHDDDDIDTLTGASTSTSRNLLTGLTVVTTQPAERDDNDQPTHAKPTTKKVRGKPAPPLLLRDVKGFGD